MFCFCWNEKSSYSVTSEPLIKFADDLLWVHTGEVMHISQGLMTHLTLETAKQLDRLNINSDDDDFINNLSKKSVII